MVIGLGASGRAAAALLARLDAVVLVTDDRAGQQPAGLPESAELVSVADACARVGEIDLVVTSPGVPHDHALLQAAVNAGVEVVSELELAARYVTAPLVAVTGTNGKSTTVTLLARILEAAGRRVFVGGNLGDPLSNAVGSTWDYCVVETSSFQLEWVDAFHPRVACILNLSPDHLDRHGTFDGYRDAKLRVFARMNEYDHAVLCRDEGWWCEHAVDLRPSRSTFGASRLAAGEAGTVYDAAARQLRSSDGLSLTISASGAWPRAPYDFANLAAAAEIVRRLGFGWDSVDAVASSFGGLDHRLRRVDAVDGVEFWNDSKATNIGATIASLEAFSGPVVLLVGGVAKGVGFESLARAAKAHCGLKRVVAFGEASGRISAALAGTVAVETAARLADAFALAAEHATAGDVVLLAPACASFDEFGGYAERGSAFVTLVADLRAAAPA